MQFNKGKGGGGGERGTRGNWVDLVKSNAKFESYYNDHGIIPAEDQEAFWAAMRRELPNSFRFTGSRGYIISLLTGGSFLLFCIYEPTNNF